LGYANEADEIRPKIRRTMDETVTFLD